MNSFPRSASHLKLLSDSMPPARPVDLGRLQWPREGVAAAGEGSNRSYTNLTAVGWNTVDRALQVEYEMLCRCVDSGETADSFWDAAGDVMGEDAFAEELALLELGVASATFALNAARCPTSISCCGHGRDFASVVFWMRPQRVPLVLEAATAAHVTVANDEDGDLAAYSDEVFGLFRFAVELRKRSVALRDAGVAVKDPHRARSGVGARPRPKQLTLLVGDPGSGERTGPRR